MEVMNSNAPPQNQIYSMQLPYPEGVSLDTLSVLVKCADVGPILANVSPMETTLSAIGTK